MKFIRETATRREDMPHQFELATYEQPARDCRVCGAGETDGRHIEWEKDSAMSRERAAAGFQRETGA